MQNFIADKIIYCIFDTHTHTQSTVCSIVQKLDCHFFSAGESGPNIAQSCPFLYASHSWRLSVSDMFLSSENTLCGLSLGQCLGRVWRRQDMTHSHSWFKIKPLLLYPEFVWQFWCLPLLTEVPESLRLSFLFCKWLLDVCFILALDQCHDLVIDTATLKNYLLYSHMKTTGFYKTLYWSAGKVGSA